MTRKSISLKSLTLISIAALIACTDKADDSGEIADDTAATDSGTTEPAPAYAWETAFDTTGSGAISGVWGSGPSDVFAVGGTPDASTIYHYDGAAWSPMDAPDVPLLVWVFGFGPDDVYAVGVDGGFVHYDGAAWTTIDSGTTEDLWGIWGASADDIWIVGGEIDDGDPIILHYDGATVAPYTLNPDENTRGAESLFKVWGIGDTLFIVGQRGLILTWDGSDWVNSPAGGEADDDFVSLWGTSEDNIVAVGGRSNGRLATWDGSAWTTQQLSGVPGLNAVNMQTDDEAVIGGIYGFTGSFTPSTNVIANDSVLTSLDVHAIWGDGQGTFYAVGGRFYDPYEGVALVRTATE